MEHTISGLVRNEPGVLALIARLFAKEKINIKSLAVGETETETASRITIVVEADNKILENITQQLSQMDMVISIDDLSRKEFIDRELILVKISTEPEVMSRVMQLVELFRANVVGVGPNTLTIEMTGDEEKIKGIIRLLKPFGIKGLARTGKIAMKRGDAI